MHLNVPYPHSLRKKDLAEKAKSLKFLAGAIPFDEWDDLRRVRPIYAYFMWFYLIIASYKEHVRSRSYAFGVSYIVLPNSRG